MSLILTWNANPEPDVTGYNVYRSLGTGPMTLLASVPTPGYTDNAVPNTTENVGYAVTAVDKAGLESVKSVTVTKAVTAIPPTAPTGLAVQ